MKKQLLSTAFEKTPCISFSCKLVPAQYRECENGLLKVSKWIKQLLYFEYFEVFSVNISFTTRNSNQTFDQPIIP